MPELASMPIPGEQPESVHEREHAPPEPATSDGPREVEMISYQDHGNLIMI